MYLTAAASGEAGWFSLSDSSSDMASLSDTSPSSLCVLAASPMLQSLSSITAFCLLTVALSLLRPVRFLLLPLSASTDEEEVSKLLSLFASAKLILAAAVLLGCLLAGAAAALDLLLLPLRVLRDPSACAGEASLSDAGWLSLMSTV